MKSTIENVAVHKETMLKTKSAITEKLIADGIITPLFAEYATRSQLKNIMNDETTREYVLNNKNILPSILEGAKNKKVRKERFNSFMNREENPIINLNRKNKREIISQLRENGYRGKLQRFNKTQLVNLALNTKPKKTTQSPTQQPPLTQTPAKAQTTPQLLTPTRPLTKKERNRQRLERRKYIKKHGAPAPLQPVNTIPEIVINNQTSAGFIKNLLQNMSMENATVSNKYGISETKYIIRLEENQKLIFTQDSPISIVEQLFNGILNKTVRENNLTNNDRISFYIESDSVRSNIHSKYMDVKELSGKTITDMVLRILQSAEKIEIKNMKMGFVFAKTPKGAGSGSTVTSLSDYYKKKGYKQIKNDDDYCFVYALYVALQQLKYEKGDITEDIYKNRIRLRSKKPILKIYEEVGIEPRMIDLTDVHIFEEHFNITINIIDFTKNNACIYPLATDEQKEDQVYLHLINNHYNTILNINSFFVAETKQEQFCNGCKRVMSLKHRCTNVSNVSICHLCHKSHDHTVSEVKCTDCLRTFENEQCFINHKDKICSSIFICADCDTYVALKSKKDVHDCNETFCSNCKASKPVNHDCFIPTIETISESTNKGLIFYDYEAYTNDQGAHVPNLIIAHRQPNDGELSKHIFRTNDEFCRWLFTEENKSYTAIAHYSKGYDIHHIKQYLYNNEIKIKFKSIDQGLKTLYLATSKPNIRFIDSISFFMCPLRALPKTFGLTNVKKGYFPHFFNKPENFSYVGPIPDKHYYGYDSMKTEDAKDFDKWYDENKNVVFDFDKEFVAYCESDVNVLREAWSVFTQQFMSLEVRPGVENELNPVNYITIASYCQAIYRCYFMPANSINIIKETNQNTSVAELEYILHLERNILNRPVDRQMKIGKYFVDAYDSITNTVYEFNGCYFHGCNKCYERNRLNRNNSKTMRMLLCDTLKKKAEIESKGYKLVTMWEHDWKKERKNHIEFINENAELLRNPNIELRKTFFGGRTEVFDTYAKSTEDTKIAYADFTSLYPSIQALAEYPIGVGRYIKENFSNINDYFGFIYCKVTPPKNLRIPVLPQTSEGKLMFHTKPMIGQWFSEELKLAVKMGYKIEEIYQVYHYDNKSKDLFSGYVRFFSKVKMENSVKNPEDCETIYQENLTAKFPIELNKSKMTYNAGLRFIAKICLNSLWGKFGQRSNMMKTDIIKNDPAKFYSIMFDKQYEVSSVLFLNEDTIEMKYKMSDDDPISTGNTNIAIASVTTGWARVWLYEAFLKVGLDNVHYCDTDSLIYSYPTNNNPIKTDSCLGGLTDELEGDGYIDELVALAPKTYAYKTSSDKLEVKAKGFTLNQVVSKSINFDHMRNMVLNENDTETVISYPSRIRLDSKTKLLKSVDETKTFKYNYTKRCVNSMNDSNTRISTTAY